MHLPIFHPQQLMSCAHKIQKRSQSTHTSFHCRQVGLPHKHCFGLEQMFLSSRSNLISVPGYPVLPNMLLLLMQIEKDAYAQINWRVYLIKVGKHCSFLGAPLTLHFGFWFCQSKSHNHQHCASSYTLLITASYFVLTLLWLIEWW